MESESPINIAVEEDLSEKESDQKATFTEITTNLTDDIKSNEPTAFKMPPIIFGPRKGINKLKKTEPLTQTTKSEKVPVFTKSPAEELKDLSTPLPYKEPDWAAVPDKKYWLEELRSGSVEGKHNLSSSMFVFGRSTKCNCKMEHPTISRFHAVLQYGQLPADDTPGFYLYDLNSTHKTFFNKLQIKPNIYVRLRVGHMMKFGLSTRMFFLQGPPEDEEPESELSVTEMKNERLKEKLAAQLANSQEKQEEGIDWGMGEDADEETDLSHNPYSLAPNEDLYIEDPKKTLRGWFEREGYELQYDCQEKGFSQFVCRVELPVDDAAGQSIVAEAVVKGKKKEAVVQCALEACRILDKHGLLRQSNHESRKKKMKDWEADDFYDSDEDTFLDRTGTVERKRQKRMQQAGVTQIAHTYSGLLEEHKRIMDEVARVQEALSTATAPATKSAATTDDELDVFMAGLAADTVDKNKINTLKAELAKLKLDEARIRTLTNIAKPAGIAELESPWPSEEGPSPSPATKPPKQLPIIGKRRTVRQPLPPKANNQAKVQKTDNSDDEEFDSD